MTGEKFKSFVVFFTAPFNNMGTLQVVFPLQFRQHSQKLGGTTEHLINGSKNRICQSSFEF